jgi:HAD superfamily hydrolase (TIGR01509 family)
LNRSEISVAPAPAKEASQVPSTVPGCAALFDFDGLILDTEWPEIEAWTEIYAEHGHGYPDEVWQNVIGRGAEQEAVRPAGYLASLTGRPVDQLSADYDARKTAKLLLQPVLPGVAKLLDEAKNLGCAVAAVSSSNHEWVEGHLLRLGLHDRFDAFFCSDDVTRTKPNPDLYLLALRSLDVTAENAVVFEDSPPGIAAGKAAGLRVIAVPNPVTIRLDLSAADIVLRSLEEVSLADWLS